MRLEKKYKKFSQVNNLNSSVPSRIFDFKSSKWKQIKKRNFTRVNGLKNVANPFIYQVPLRSVENIKNYYKKNLNLKKFLILLFNNSIKVPFLKKELVFNSKKSLKDLLLNCFIKPLFRIDILLAQLDFFTTSFGARQYINEGKVLLNSKRVKSNYVLKKGDIISFKGGNSNFFFKVVNSNSKFKFYSFIEVDSYLKTIIITKDLKMFSGQDINLIVQNFFDLNTLKNYL